MQVIILQIDLTQNLRSGRYARWLKINQKPSTAIIKTVKIKIVKTIKIKLIKAVKIKYGYNSFIHSSNCNFCITLFQYAFTDELTPPYI